MIPKAIGTALRRGRSMPKRALRLFLRLGLPVIMFGGVIWGPKLAWTLRPTRHLGFVIVDKSVPFGDYRKHRALTWVLHNLKVGTPGRPFAVASRDYIGFDPATKEGRDITAADFSGVDVLIIADTYGVYAGDYPKHATPIAHDENALPPHQKLFGGLSDREAELIDRFAAGGGRVIAEFNTFGPPTEESARQRLEHVFGVRWTHWVARYFDDLADAHDVPPWVRNTYKKVTGKTYGASGPGFVFVHDDDDLFLLQPGGQLEHDLSAIEQRHASQELGSVPESTRFLGWIDVVESTQSDVLYEHVLHVTDDGRAILRAHGLPSRFPALTRRQGQGAYYFAADISDTTLELGDPERAGLLFYRRLTLREGVSTDEEKFLWGFYAPLVEALVAPRYR